VLVLVYGLLGFGIALPLGVFTAKTGIEILAGIINFDPPAYVLTPSTIMLQAALSLMIPLLAGLVPILQGTRVSVRDALSFTGLDRSNFGDGWVERWTARIESLPRPLLLSIRNMFRKKSRFILTVLTLTLGSMTFIAVMNVQAAMGKTLDETLRYFNFDFQVYFDRPYRMEQVLSEVQRISEVETAETWGMTNTHILFADDTESDDLILSAPPQETQMIQPRLIEGRWLLPEDENAVVINTDVVKMDPTLTVGSTVNLLINGSPDSWTVVGIAQSAMMGPWMYANYSYYAYHLNKVGLSQAVYIQLKDHIPTRVQAAADQVERVLEQAGIHVRSTALVNDLRQTAQLQFNVVLLFLILMSVVIALVGCLGLMGTMSLNVLERTREMGVIRAIGGSNGAILQLFISEGVILGLISWVLGAVLAWPFGRLMSDVVGQSFIQAPLLAQYSGAGAGLWLAILLVLSALSSLFPAMRAARLPVRDVLAYE
ncbi:MAG TPA: FtsX-like permease family protein, partial [Anaerolineaceae bacterium]|nr:FtsX-like permease family protein [Anaerolineaceae bacterium]